MLHKISNLSWQWCNNTKLRQIKKLELNYGVDFFWIKTTLKLHLIFFFL